MKQLFRYNIFLTLTFVITVSCNTTPRVIYEEKGLVKGKPGMNRYTEVEAGESSLLEKPYFIAPNLIPHSIVDFSITKESNDCLDCHFSQPVTCLKYWEMISSPYLETDKIRLPIPNALIEWFKIRFIYEDCFAIPTGVTSDSGKVMYAEWFDTIIANHQNKSLLSHLRSTSV